MLEFLSDYLILLLFYVQTLAIKYCVGSCNQNQTNQNLMSQTRLMN